MSMLGRLFAACSLIGLVLMAASVACPECLAALGLDFADFSEQLNSLAQASADSSADLHGGSNRARRRRSRIRA